MSLWSFNFKLIKYCHKATEYSWVCEYIGNASEELWNHINKAFRDPKVKYYAYYLAIVQSSGMGKSRSVDELSKKHIVIPMNLRDAKSGGRYRDPQSSYQRLTTPFPPFG